MLVCAASLKGRKDRRGKGGEREGGGNRGKMNGRKEGKGEEGGQRGYWRGRKEGKGQEEGKLGKGRGKERGERVNRLLICICVPTFVTCFIYVFILGKCVFALWLLYLLNTMIHIFF